MLIETHAVDLSLVFRGIHLLRLFVGSRVPILLGESSFGSEFREIENGSEGRSDDYSFDRFLLLSGSECRSSSRKGWKKHILFDVLDIVVERGSGVSENVYSFDRFVESSFFSDVFDDNPGEVLQVLVGVVGVPSIGLFLRARCSANFESFLEVSENNGRGDETSST